MKKFTIKKETRRNNFSSRIFTVLVALLLVAGAQAQSIFSIVGNGNTSNTSTGYPAPYGNWYYGSHHQMRVTAAELVNAGMSPGANVTSVGFNITATNGAANMQNWQVTVYTTTATNPLGTGYVTSGAVATSTLTTWIGTVGWNQTQISPFVWNGTSDLIIETCQVNPGGYTYNYSTVYTTTLTGTEVKTRYEYQDLITTCPNNATYNSTTTRPDIRFEWNYLTPCSGTPANNSVVTPTFAICANVPYGAIGLATSYTTSGLTYQWMQATQSNVGPFSPATGNSTGWTYSVPGLTTTTYYALVITCTNSNQSYTTTGSPVQVAVTTTNTVPYNEGFENIGQNDRLPNCSWFATNQGTTVKTWTTSQSNNRLARTGNAFASFQLPSTNNILYSNGIYMEPGITYSAGAFYSTEYFGYTNWTNLSVLLGANQSTSGLSMIASATPAASGPYKLLGGSFTVPSAGIYYLAFRATGTSGSAPYLNIDDIFVNIPCTPSSGNSPTVQANASNNVICQGDQVSINATGGDVYMWNNGNTTNGIAVSPNQTSTYFVTGTNTLTGCTNTKSVTITVNETPQVWIIGSKSSVCPGESAYLTAYGAPNYMWSNNAQGNPIQVSPLNTTTFAAVGTGTNGCSGTAVYTVSVKPTPTISVASGSGPDICKGDNLVLTANGAVSYSWLNSSTSLLMNGSPLSVTLSTSTSFTVTGTGANGCSNKATFSQNVSECTSINENSVDAGLTVYPNPTSGLFNIELKSGLISSVVITDIAGRVVSTTTASENSVMVNVSGLAAGVYYARVNSENGSSVVRVIKN